MSLIGYLEVPEVFQSLSERVFVLDQIHIIDSAFSLNHPLIRMTH